MKHGKKYVDAAKLVDRTKLYDTNEALDTVIKTATAKFIAWNQPPGWMIQWITWFLPPIRCL